MSYQDINFQAEAGALLDRDGNEIPSEMARGIYRKDTGALLSTCGARYHPIQHTDVLDPVLQTLKDESYELVERPYGKRDLYDLKGQRGAFVSYLTSDNGAKLRANIIVGDFIQPTGKSPYLEDGPATMFREFSVFNSHDMSLAARMDPGYKVLQCMNGIRSTAFSASIRTRHTSGFNVEGFKRQILASAQMMQGDAPRFEKYVSTPCTLDQAQEFLKRTFCRLADKPTGEMNWSQRLLDQLLERFKNYEPQTIWGLYMAMTYYATHGETKTSSNPMTTGIRREEAVARAVRSAEFDALMGWDLVVA